MNSMHLGDDTVGEYRVSTVRLSELLRYFPGLLPPPSNGRYETMVFHSSHPWLDVFVDRYETAEDAIQGHQKVVGWLNAGLLPPFEQEPPV